MALQGTIKDNKLILTIDLATEPYVSNREAGLAAKAGRPPVAQMLASSGGFTRIGDVRVSFNVIK